MQKPWTIGDRRHTFEQQGARSNIGRWLSLASEAGVRRVAIDHHRRRDLLLPRHEHLGSADERRATRGKPGVHLNKSWPARRVGNGRRRGAPVALALPRGCDRPRRSSKLRRPPPLRRPGGTLDQTAALRADR